MSSPVLIAAVAAALAVAGLVLFVALRRVLGRPGRVAYSAEENAEFDRLEPRLEAVVAAELYLNPAMDLAGLALALGTSPRLASRLLNARRGRNAAAFLSGLRAQAAAERLVAHPDLPIRTVMYDAGFNSRSLFNAAFHRELGMSPSEYRARRARA